MRFVSRREWGARAPRNRSGIGDVLGVTVHWHGPGLGNYSHGRCDNLVRSMQAYHMDTNGWSDIGYSALVCRHGWVFEGRGIGIRGAHTGASGIGGNSRWYGLQAMVGTGDDLTEELFAGLRDGIAWFRRSGADKRVNGHRDHHATECPGDRLYRWAHGSPMEEDDDVSAKDVWTWDRIRVPWKRKGDDNWQWQTQHALASIWDNSWKAHREARQMRAEVRAELAAIREGCDPEETARRVDAAVKAALEDFEAELADAEVVLRTGEENPS